MVAELTVAFLVVDIPAPDKALATVIDNTAEPFADEVVRGAVKLSSEEL